MEMDDSTALTREELEERIASVEEELDDLAAERSLTLGGTGVHIGAKEADRMRREFERDEEKLRSQLAELKSQLGS